MNRIVSVRWRTADPLTNARVNDVDVSRNNQVIIETDKGQEFGWVVGEPQTLVFTQPEEERLAMVVRKTTASDFGRIARNFPREIHRLTVLMCTRNRSATSSTVKSFIPSTYLPFVVTESL